MDKKAENVLTIVLGFGGSGGKTLAHLAELLTHNQESAERASKYLHFVLCDTDENDLRERTKEIAKSFNDRSPGVAPLKVDAFSLAAEADIFCDLVQERLDGMDAQELSEFKSHWWFKGQIPFSATGLPMTVAAGAGQCPLVSHFLAWDRLAKFEELLGRIDAHAKNHRRLEDYRVELMIVSSLAGGTGRGCWQVMSLKAREFFGRNRQECRPTGFFLDQSVFQSIQLGSSEQHVKFKINSLTGLSELAMWLNCNKQPLRREGGGTTSEGVVERSFSLPDLRNVKEKIVDTERFMPVAQAARVGRSPIYKAYVFTNEGASLHIEDPLKAYKLCAASMFGKLMLGPIRSADQNKPGRAAATSTSIFYVPIADIRNAMLFKTRAECARKMLGEQADRVRVQDLLSRVRDLLEIPEPRAVCDSMGEYASQVHVQSIVHDYVIESRDIRDRQSLEEALGDGPMEQIEADFVHYALDAGKRYSDNDRFYSSVQQVLMSHGREQPPNAKLDNDTLAQSLLELIWNGGPSDSLINWGLYSLVSENKLGLVAVRHSLNELKNLVEELYIEANSAARGASDSSEHESDEGSKETRQFMDSVKKAKRTIRLGRSFMDAAYSNELMKQADQLYSKAAFPKVAALWAGLLNSLGNFTAQLIARCEEAIKEIERTRHNLERAFEQSLKPSSGACCFISLPESERDADIMLDYLAKAKDPILRCLRPIFPIYDAENVAKCVSAALEGKPGNSTARDVQAFMSEFLSVPKVSPFKNDKSILFLSPAGQLSDDRAFFRHFAGKSDEVLQKPDVPNDVMDSFALPTVIDGIVRKCFELYEKNGDPAFRQQFDDAMVSFLGVSPRQVFVAAKKDEEVGLNRKRYEPPPLSETLAQMSIVAARSCDPLMRMGMSVPKADSVRIFVPQGNDCDETCEKLNREWHELDGRDHFLSVRAEKNSDNPFMLIVNADYPKSDFQELDANGTLIAWTGWPGLEYYRDSQLSDWLKWIEDPGGRSVFEEGRDDSIGLGYLHPCYVREEHWRSRRWKPWFNEKQHQSRNSRKWHALAYAILGNDMYDLDADSPKLAEKRRELEKDNRFLIEYHELCEALRSWAPVEKDFADERWTFPLLRETKGNGGPKFERQIFVKGSNQIRLNRGGIDPRKWKFSDRKFFAWLDPETMGHLSQVDKEWTSSDEFFEKVWEEQCIFARTFKQRVDDAEEFGEPVNGERKLMDRFRLQRYQDNTRLALARYVEGWCGEISQGHSRTTEEKQLMQAVLQQFLVVLNNKQFNVLEPFDDDRGIKS